MNSIPITRPQRFGGPDHVLLTIALLLTIIGLVTVYSAGSERSMAIYGNPHLMFLRQLSRAVLGFGILALTIWLPYRVWRPFAIPALVVAMIFLLMLIVSGLGETSNGATRWLRLGSVRFQPSEVAKYALVLFIAAWASRRGQRMRRFGSGIVIPLGVAGVMAVLIYLQPDFSSAALLMFIALVLVFFAGVKAEHLIVLIAPMTMLAWVAIRLSPYQWNRVQDFIMSWNRPENATYQMMQSWIGLGRGGIFGVGLGESRQKLLFLPDAHTDFIYSVIGEEWGLLGTLFLLLLFILLIVRGFRIAMRSPEPFAGYLAAGITFAIGIYALVNMSISTGVLPTTGLPLPFISYGGTSLMMTLGATGIILNISKYAVPRNGRGRFGGAL